MNRMPRPRGLTCRLHAFTKRPVDVSEEPPMLIWATELSVVESEANRGADGPLCERVKTSSRRVHERSEPHPTLAVPGERERPPGK